METVPTFDAEQAWRDELAASRAADDLLLNALLLSDTTREVKHASDAAEAAQRAAHETTKKIKPIRGSPAWWKEWKKSTESLRKNLNSEGLGSKSVRSHTQPAPKHHLRHRDGGGPAPFSKLTGRDIAAIEAPGPPTGGSVPDLVAQARRHKRGPAALGSKIEPDCNPSDDHSTLQGHDRHAPSSRPPRQLSPIAPRPGPPIPTVESKQSVGVKVRSTKLLGTRPVPLPSTSKAKAEQKRRPMHENIFVSTKPMFSFGSEKRNLGSVVDRSPGPVYTPDYLFGRRKETSVKFGTEERKTKTKASTDVQYKLPDTVGSGPTVIINSGAARPWDAEEKKQKLVKQASMEVAAEAQGQEYVEEVEETYVSDWSGGFGFGCSLEEHVLYGECLDGKCATRSRLEKSMARSFKKKQREEELQKKEDSRGRRGGVTESTLDDSSGKRRKTALHFAAEKNNLDVVHKLLLDGAKLNTSDEEGHTALALACAKGNVRVVQRMLLNAQYPLVSGHGFVKRRHPPMINLTDDMGRTPLHRAAEAGHHEIVKLLLEAGANAEVLDRENKTALDLCNAPKAFGLLRSRAEVYNRRERLAGVALKKQLVESAEEAEDRTEAKLLDVELQDTVRALDAAKEIMGARVLRVDDDVMNYRRNGELLLNTKALEQSSHLGVEELVGLCFERQEDGASTSSIMTELGMAPKETRGKKKRP